MAAWGSQVRMPILAPTPPDFHVCSPMYGMDLDIYDCLRAVDQLARGSRPMPYREGLIDSPYGLPLLTSAG